MVPPDHDWQFVPDIVSTEAEYRIENSQSILAVITPSDIPDPASNVTTDKLAAVGSTVPVAARGESVTFVSAAST